MIASSTTSPMARINPQRVSVLIENPKAAIIAKVATSATGMAIMGMIVAPHALKEDENDQKHEQERFEQGLFDLADILADIFGRVVGDAVFEAGGKLLASRSMLSRTWRTMSSALASAY